jgi:crotonobetainyl-CoA:carnitine CoA-transferase CaiB-like acyl-CoA transferase
VFPCKGEDEWVAVSTTQKSEWEGLCSFVDRLDWVEKDDLWYQNNSELLRDSLSRVTRKISKGSVSEAMDKYGIKSVAVINASDRLTHPYFLDRQGYVSVETKGHTRLIRGIPIKLSDNPGSVRFAAPDLGQHNKTILREICGVSESEYEELESLGVVGTAPAKRPIN